MFLGINTVAHTYLFVFLLILFFIIGYVMDAIMTSSGFGVFGNQFVCIAGFYLGLKIMHYYGRSVRDFQEIMMFGIASAFALLFSLVILKVIIARF